LGPKGEARRSKRVLTNFPVNLRSWESFDIFRSLRYNNKVMAPTLLSEKTYMPKKGCVERKWHLVDVKDQVLGRLSTQIANLLTGKGKTIYTPAVDCGDFVVAVNVGQVRLTGDKINQKVAFHHTFHPGGARIVPYKKLMQERPERVLYLAVRRMLPKNRIASRQILRLKIYRSSSHPHQVQNPQKI